MPVSGQFLSALQMSPGWGSKTLAFKSGSVANTTEYDATVAATYGDFEWSFEPVPGNTGFLVKGGTDLACRHGGAALLEALGYRFYWPYTQSWVIPQTINMAVSAAKQKFLMPDNVMALAYGHVRGSTIESEWFRWITLNGVDQELYLAGHRWNSIGIDVSIRNSGFWTARPGLLYDVRHSSTAEPSAAFTPDGVPPSGASPVMTITAQDTNTYKRGSTRLLADFTVNGNDGAVSIVLSRYNTKPIAQQIIDGQNHLGETVPSRAVTVTASGSFVKHAVPLNPRIGAPTSECPLPSTNYYMHAVYRNAAGQTSPVVSVMNGAGTSVLAMDTTSANCGFNLQTAIDNGWYTDLVNLYAANLITAGLNEINTTSSDAADSDSQSSDLVFSFTKDAADAIRAGTPAVGPYASKSPIPQAQLGIYAYAGHRRPPADSVSPGVFTQVALGFNKTELTYFDLVRLHAEKADAIKLREYWGTPIWDRAQPLRNGRALDNYFYRYTNSDPEEGYIAAAAASGRELLGTHAECSANHLANLIMFRWGILTLRGVTTTYEAVLQEIVDDIFNGDPKVVELYTFFGYRLNRWHKYSLQTAMEIVNQMQTSWYKTLFQQWMVFCYEWLTLPSQLDTTSGSYNPLTDPFPAAFSNMMKHAWAMGDTHIIQSYGVARVEANGAVIDYYPSLKYDASPLPAWRTGAVVPTTQEFTDALAALQASNDRDPELDSADVILVTGLNSRDGVSTPGNGFYARAGVQYGAIGPGRLRVDWPDTSYEDSEGNTVTEEGGTEYIPLVAGWQVVDILDTAKVTPIEGARAYMITFPTAYKYSQESTGNSYLYIQEEVAGNVKIKPGSRVQVYDQTGTITIYPQGFQYTGPYNNIGPGVVRVDYTNTQGMTTENIVPYLALDPNEMAIPRAVALADFGARGGKIAINRG